MMMMNQNFVENGGMFVKWNRIKMDEPKMIARWVRDRVFMVFSSVIGRIKHRLK